MPRKQRIPIAPRLDDDAPAPFGLPNETPGQALAALLDQHHLSAHKVAGEIGVDPMLLSRVRRDKQPVTVPTALRLGRYFGTGPVFWILRQLRYDLQTELATIPEADGQPARQVPLHIAIDHAVPARYEPPEDA